jgi:hypothetical protein
LETKKKKKRKSEIRKKKENEEGKSFWRNGGRKARAGRTRTAPSFKCINGKKGVAAAYLKRMMAWWRGGGAEGDEDSGSSKFIRGRRYADEA